MTPGAKIKAIRNLQGLNQSQFARRIGMQQWAISALEGDQVAPNQKVIDSIYAAFGIRLDSPEVEAAFSVLVGR
jgi:transcriptional regulator with XRE-family HTH domain